MMKSVLLLVMMIMNYDDDDGDEDEDIEWISFKSSDSIW